MSRAFLPANAIDQHATSRLAPYQRQASLVALLIAVISTALIPFADAHWPNVASFLPVYQTATICCYAVVAYLIHGYFRQTHQRALLYLWGGCVYTSAILLVQFFSFPSAFVPNIRLLGGAQTPSWLWFCWHLGSTGMLFGYALSEWRNSGARVEQPRAAFARCVALTAAALLVSVLAVTVFHNALPVVDVGGDFSRITRTGYAPLIQAIIVAALLMLWRATRFATPISAWLGVAMIALVFDNAITMAGGTRLSIGWYVGRFNALLSALVMLALYLKEVNRVYLTAASNAGKLAKANDDLASEHARLLKLFEQAPGFVAVLAGEDNQLQIVNAAFERLVGRRDIVGRPLREALPELEGQGYFELIETVRTQGQAHVGSAMAIALRRQPGADLEEMFIDVLFQPNKDANGVVTGIFIQGSDVTEQRRARTEVEHHQQHLQTLVMERTKSLEDAQMALMHAQKLEAIGKLTGGVAHDFNNVLHIIKGNIDLIKMFTPANDKIHLRCESAQGAIKRGAKLSSQLLSFARKQPLQPDVISLPSVLADIDLLLKRAVGERIEVALQVCQAPWNVKVDLQQLENVILNLALNSRDAMPTGGEVTIAVDNVMRDAAGYVQLSFRDNGEGMSAEVRARAFEPFFSTKGIGKGTGLGLSMAYGFVKQSGGDIDIDSAPGAGTTIRILLPRTVDASAGSDLALAKKSSPQMPVQGNNELVLVVDDEREIQENVSTMLRELGYRVVTASSADEAVTLLDQHQHIDLLFTDVIMPGQVSATMLAERARAQHPAIHVLFTSGYTENAVIHNGRLDEGVNLLSKPYGRDDLAGAVHRLLARDAQAA